MTRATIEPNADDVTLQGIRRLHLRQHDITLLLRQLHQLECGSREHSAERVDTQIIH